MAGRAQGSTGYTAEGVWPRGANRHDPRRHHRERQAAHRQAEGRHARRGRSEEHTSELQSLMRISYAVFCLKKKKTYTKVTSRTKYNEGISDQSARHT